MKRLSISLLAFLFLFALNAQEDNGGGEGGGDDSNSGIEMADHLVWLFNKQQRKELEKIEEETNKELGYKTPTLMSSAAKLAKAANEAKEWYDRFAKVKEAVTLYKRIVQEIDKMQNFLEHVKWKWDYIVNNDYLSIEYKDYLMNQMNGLIQAILNYTQNISYLITDGAALISEGERLKHINRTISKLDSASVKIHVLFMDLERSIDSVERMAKDSETSLFLMSAQ